MRQTNDSGCNFVRNSELAELRRTGGSGISVVPASCGPLATLNSKPISPRHHAVTHNLLRRIKRRLSILGGCG
jgi:hypothetical protein